MASNAFNATNLSGLRADFETAQTFVSANFDPAGQVSFGNDATVNNTATVDMGLSAPQI